MIHKESEEIIYYKAIGDLNPEILDIFRNSVHYKILELPLEEGYTEQATLEGKYLITRAGKLVWITLILKYKPIVFTRGILKAFCNLFENLYEREIKELYSKFNGDISIFRKDPYSKRTLNNIIEDVFHLYLIYPFKISSPRGKNMSLKSKEIFQIAKVLSHKAKGQILLDKLFTEISNSFTLSNEEASSLIYELIDKKVLIPIQLEKIKFQFN